MNRDELPFSLKGWDPIAQGIALGHVAHPRSALKGRYKSSGFRVAPFQGLAFRCTLHPGLRPGLSNLSSTTGGSPTFGLDRFARRSVGVYDTVADAP